MVSAKYVALIFVTKKSSGLGKQTRNSCKISSIQVTFVVALVSPLYLDSTLERGITFYFEDA